MVPDQRPQGYLDLVSERSSLCRALAADNIVGGGCPCTEALLPALLLTAGPCTAQRVV